MALLSRDQLSAETVRILMALNNCDVALVSGSYFDAVGAALIFNATFRWNVITVVVPQLTPVNAQFYQELFERRLTCIVEPRGVNLGVQYTPDYVVLGDPNSIGLGVEVCSSYDRPVDFDVDLASCQITYSDAWLARIKKELGYK